MITTEFFFSFLIKNGISQFYGVPDSLLKEICAYITYSVPKKQHIITANEGNAIALAAGSYLSTQKPALVYMQNSGIGNAINPLVSLMDEMVYQIPVLLMIGWRGEPGVHDEPQHVKQGMITKSMLETIGIPFTILTDNYESEVIKAIQYMEFYKKPYALIVRANSFSKFAIPISKEKYEMSREEALKTIIESTTKEDIIVSTTGKSSREIYEIREKLSQSHDNDFLTVGSMGHASSIALGIALNTSKKVYTIDGDGAFLMHMGATAINNQNAPFNFKYILINNRSHESVGGQPTIANQINIKQILLGMGFKNVFEVNNKNDLVRSLTSLSNLDKSALIVNVSIGSRSDLGRPKTSPIENKIAFMNKLKS